MHGWLASKRAASSVLLARIHNWRKSKESSSCTEVEKSHYIHHSREWLYHMGLSWQGFVSHLLLWWRHIPFQLHTTLLQVLHILWGALKGTVWNVVTFLWQSKAITQLSSINYTLITSVITFNVITEPYLSSSSISLLFDLFCMQLKTLHQGE